MAVELDVISFDRKRELRAVIEKIVGVEKNFLFLDLLPDGIEIGVVGFDKRDNFGLVLEGEAGEDV